jgi:ElaB/YqjD/DUF883 family membrane-anchored ribosome-binding protein
MEDNVGKDSFEKTRDFVDEKIARTKEYLGASFAKTRERVDDLLTDARKNWGPVSSRLEDQYEELSEDLRKYVRSNPLRAIGYAAGIGLILGLWIGRRGD